MYLRASSAAEMLDLPISSFYQLVREGQLPLSVSKLGKHQLWSREQLIATVDPRGYKAAHEHQAAAGRPPASPTVGPGEVCVSARARDLVRRNAGKAAGRSPYAGILGSAVGRPTVCFEPLDLDPSDHRHG
jgi:hypothetical protein